MGTSVGHVGGWGPGWDALLGPAVMDVGGRQQADGDMALGGLVPVEGSAWRICSGFEKEQIGIAIANAAGRLCLEGQPLALTPAECLELTNIGYAMERPREDVGQRAATRQPRPPTAEAVTESRLE